MTFINPLSKSLLTEDELNLPYEHNGENFTFKCKVGITIEEVQVIQKSPIAGGSKRFDRLLIEDITSFIGMWTINYYERMPSFSGFGGIKYRFN